MEPTWLAPFLQALAGGSTVSEAAQAAGISSSTAYARRKADDDFRAAWDEALEDSADVLEAEARRRAIHGVEEPVVYQGQLTPVWERDEHGEVVIRDDKPVQARNRDGSLKWLTIRKPSDSLLMMLLKGRRKAVFSDRTELAGVPGAPIVVDETVRAARLAAILAELKDRKDMVG